MNNPYICECCGGRINRATMKCEYCDTQYAEVFPNEKIIRVETYINPIETYRTRITLRDSDLLAIERTNGDYTKLILEELASELTKALLPNIRIDVERHIGGRPWDVDIYGTVKVVRPVHSDDSLDSLRYTLRGDRK